MKITISKNTFTVAQEEIADVITEVSGDKLETYPLKHVVAHLNSKELRYFYWEESERDISLIVEDEVIFEVLRFYRRLAKPINGLVSAIMNLGLVIADEMTELSKAITRKK